MKRSSTLKDQQIREVKTLYNSKKSEILLRMEEFTRLWETGTKTEIFAELAFCILTPMARGKSCAKAVENMVREGVLYTGGTGEIMKELIGARFINKKSAYIVEARERFLGAEHVCLKSILTAIDDSVQAREWLVENVKGIGYKEASHFLRNIGYEGDLAILDRHIVKNLRLMGVIEEIPDSLSKRRYFDIERTMREFSIAIEIPMSHLDFTLWCKETGEILK
jgi:N-glycosylase/DNA lyase